MIIWEKTLLPKVDWDYEGPEDTYYSHRVLVFWRFKRYSDSPQPGFGRYIRYRKKGPDTPKAHWLVDGVSGEVEVLGWTYINACE